MAWNRDARGRALGSILAVSLGVPAVAHAEPPVSLGVAGVTSPPPAPPTAARVWIYGGGTGIELNREHGGGRSNVICRGTCGEMIAHDPRPLTIDGDRLLRSRRFHLPHGAKEVHIEVRGHLARFVGGLTLAAGGGVALGFSSAFALWSYEERIAPEPGSMWREDRRAAITLLAIGVPLVVGGILLALSGRTRVRVRAVR
jgi:hypothetical protein